MLGHFKQTGNYHYRLKKKKKKKKRFLVIKIQKTWNLHAGHKFTSTLKESYMDNSSSSSVSFLQRDRTSSEEFVDALAAQCDGDVLPTKLETCQNRRWKMKMTEISKDKFDIYALLLSLGRYFCWWTISPLGYHPPNSQCFNTDMV